MFASSTVIPEAALTSLCVVSIPVAAPPAKQATRAEAGVAWRKPAPPSWQAGILPLHQRCAALMHTSTPPVGPEHAGWAALSSPIGTGSKIVVRKSSSLVPSQSSSIRLHTSARTGGALHPTQLPPLHVSVPLPHAVEQPRESPSSTRESQSSSAPLHVSAPGRGAVHPTQLPVMQVSVPIPHVVLHPRE